MKEAAGNLLSTLSTKKQDATPGGTLDFGSTYPIEEVIDCLREEGRSICSIKGPKGGLLAAVLAQVSQEIDRPMVVLTERSPEGEQIYGDLQSFIDPLAMDPESTIREEVLHYPGYDVGPFYQATPDRKVTMRRLATLHRLLEIPRPRFVVASIGAAMRKTLAKSKFESYRYLFGIGEELENQRLREIMQLCGFTEVAVVEDPGTFAVRGDVVDLFPPHEEHPIRLERWGDEIAEIRLFHSETQRSLEEREYCAVYPVREAILDESSVKIAIGKLREENSRMGRNFSALRDLISDLQAGLHVLGIEALLPALHEEMASLVEYLPDDALIVLIEPEHLSHRGEALWEKHRSERDAASDEGELLFAVEEYYESPSYLLKKLHNRASILWESLRISSSKGDCDREMIEFRVRPNVDIESIRRTHPGTEEIVKELARKFGHWQQEFGRLIVACRTEAQGDRLRELLKIHGVQSDHFEGALDLSHPLPPPVELVEIYSGHSLSSGFRDELRGIALISGEEIFGQRVAVRKNRSFTEQASITHFKDLNEGDLVVHVDFGIGRYLGIEHLEVEGIGNDFLSIEYAQGDRLFLPAYRLGRVQKYIGSSDGVALDRMGGSRWEKTKEKVKENIRAIAGDLLALYARREMARGIAYSPPDEFYRKFEEAFPFEETPDQQQAIEDVLEDMIRVRPMDRLICGDVGFGKTEVAIRAAMKAVVDGRQVAVLVPTTLLAEQHLISFRNRMEEFGVRVESLSRFRSSKDSRKILEDATLGKVDVLIGTHRLLSKDLDFASLGLLIVDEEQRFGVNHKEKIKKLKNDIDVLTLSATPIPRTLQMSMLGIRDLTIIATPPHNRLSVRTHVAKFSDSIIREAIMRELSRGGQVFFVHNRVQSIDEMAAHLKEVVPEARIGIGHGQMSEGELEKVMVKYVQGEINVLLCTSIVESGLDIPNANTILVNRADRFGLSQLYQLRGRVGRGKIRAYAYLLVANRGKLPDDARKRLEVIQTFTDLGSGFHIASYDLEIRGAGNLLSDDQSGHVAAVGLDLYSELLEEAIHDLRGEEPDEVIEPEVNIKIEAFLPDTYIPATSLRLLFYKRFSLAKTQDELEEVYEEMVDRFGLAPTEARNLHRLVSIKVDLRRVRAHRLDAGMTGISIELDRKTTLNPARVVEMVNQSAGKWRLTSEMKLIYKLDVAESEQPLETSRALLDSLLAL